jgi:hypothetical protein
MFCLANGMDLFDISSEESKIALLDYATELYGEGGGAVVQVKGRETGECQYMTNEYGPFEVLYGYCYDDYYSFCGYQSPNPIGNTEIPTKFERKLV